MRSDEKAGERIGATAEDEARPRPVLNAASGDVSGAIVNAGDRVIGGLPAQWMRDASDQPLVLSVT